MKNFKISKIIFLLVLVYLILLVYFLYRPFFIFFFLLFLASISRMYNHIYWLPQLGFELYSTATVLTGLLLGPWLGLLQGILSQFFAYFFSGKIKHYAIIGMSSWAIIGFICGLIRNLDFSVTQIGIFFVVLYEAITTPLFRLSGVRTFSAIFHLITHIIISVFLFSTIVPILYNILR